ncbi:hypothetical protein [Amphritea balenae]|uniref:Uncharacterized protein n=1 Tax=Amphritea balenae TaxID=452629 RepID=A0A3P1SWF2_9GAMM|nr:hypothetical protein [Amphritea balenae]RRD01305.1 hypothetical protein EHS89_01720 [Amphritea balenae]GGK58316.1 hypothetical protein GCM10007941_05520 [Amphritea balenae]
MISMTNYMKTNEPAFGETEMQYFERMGQEYSKLHKAELRKQRYQNFMNRLESAGKALRYNPNPFYK